MFVSLVLTEVACCECLTHFAMDRELNTRCLETGRWFYCPNGHRQYYTETEVQRLKKANQSLRRRAEWAEESNRQNRDRAAEAERSRAAYKGQLTKTRRRIANGVCPCCNRTFNNLSRHMDSKHPDYKAAVS